MSFSKPCYPEDRAARYELILAQAVSLLDETLNPIANLANMAALLADALPRINWCGFYLLDGGMLTLGPFCGLPACTKIPLGRGVCGTAARKDEVQRVADVHAFPGHIACDSASRSEIVIPLHHQGRVIGVLDIDSPDPARFDELDERYLVQLATRIQTVCRFEPTPCNKRAEATSPPNISTPAIIRIFTYSKKKPTVGLYACRRFLLFIRLSPWPLIRGRSSPQLRNRRCSPSDIDTRLSPRHSHSPSRRYAPHIPACSGRSPRRPSP